MSMKNLSPNLWYRSAAWRRALLLALILFPTAAACRTMASVLPSKGGTPLEVLLLILFGVLFAWISVGFWTAFMGFVLLLAGKNRYSPSNHCRGRDLSIADVSARTAVLIPVYNEDVKKVMAGLEAVYDSLERTGSSDRFDFFVLSDSTDPDVWVEEEAAWHRFCSDRDCFGRVFYRKRRSNAKRKSGNIADFCRRWGKNYRYMIVFDADSVMAGRTMVRMVQIMEDRPDIGILQTPPAGVNRETFIARAQQFANRVYGPMFAAGIHFWQLGDGQYWGHNAIIRVEPFTKHCQLPRLSGKGALSGDILSHDFVESALMRRAGYGVWLAYDLDGSYEETPPTLLDELKRDRRWCQGNLQHMRLMFTRGFFPTHRALFLNGVLSYGSALLWLVFLLISSVQALAEVVLEPSYFLETKTLFPQWPVWHPHWALALLGSTAVLLFLPKLLSFSLVLLKDPGASSFGGRGKLAGGILVEVLLSTLLAPIRMIHHSLFVIGTLLGKDVGWGTQSRDDRGTAWVDAASVHWWATLLGIVWGGLLYLVNPSFFPWISPIVLSLAFSVPLSVFTSRVSVGRSLRRLGLLVIPEEIRLPRELAEVKDHIDGERPPYSPFSFSERQGFLRAVTDPRVHGLHISLLASCGHEGTRIRPDRLPLVDRAIAEGPGSLGSGDKMELLKDPAALAELHRRVWTLEDDLKASEWGIGFSPAG
ncbi:glucans biosynthesis glucosyltransferase MdoH [Dethiosulfovibrio sp. F2B]|uniref:glucans biosynthesis glucosyltransferase MdoH n=1 Tax=Dethiosulfovibrio faecalis TaxID=2720018 RepID=UPI001F387F3C|nr:glucans biosynthesis glucosyltransferase MdoH [Dethiosulfovibrio faecalis]MCF4150960.1 glucans biosynthesis glucosyltransferase MdoH [Dethiosulfovibrio faecalis]